jgi:hypothetical protein
MIFSEVIGAFAILAGLYFIGLIISRATLLSARRQEVELAHKEIMIKREELDLLEGEVQELKLIGEGDEEFQEEAKRITKEKLEVIIGGKVEPKNRW